MKMRSLLFSAVLVSALSTASAFADTMFNFSFSGTNFSGSGVFTTMSTATAGEYLITGVTGTTNGQMISGVVAPNGGGFNGDNLLYYNSPASSTYFDLFGVTYLLAANPPSKAADVNLFFQQNSYGEYLATVNGKSFLFDQSAISVSPVGTSPVPEPESLLLLGTGALGLVGILRRRVRL